jgi:hypothetical protein
VGRLDRYRDPSAIVFLHSTGELLARTLAGQSKVSNTVGFDVSNHNPINSERRFNAHVICSLSDRGIIESAPHLMSPWQATNR